MPAKPVSAKRPPLINSVGEAALLFLATLAAYGPALHGGLLWDDLGHITRPDLRSLHGLWRIWTELGATQQYYPVLHSAFWIEHRLWGDALLAYHLANVTLHAVAALLLVWILRRLAIPGALLAGAVFALHPICVESVAWISEQKNTLSAVFYLGSMLAYLAAQGPVEQGFSPVHRAKALSRIAFVLFVLAVLSKSVTASLPAALLVVLWWKRGRLEWKRDVAPLVPWFAVAVVGGVFTAWVEREVIGAKGAEFSLSLVQRGMLAGRVLWFYLATLLWPSNLIFIYPRWTLDAWSWPQYLFPLAAIAAAVCLWLVRGRSRAPLAGLLFFAGTLFPALGFVNVYPFRFSFVADHFQYLASLGVIVPVAALLSRAADGPPESARGRPGGRRMIGRMACFTLVLILGALTWRQAGLYRDAETLYRDTIARNPDCWMAYLNLGTEVAENPKRLEEAVGLFESALRIEPDHPQARRDLALAHIRLAASMSDDGERLPEAIRHYDEAVRVLPETARTEAKLGSGLHLNLGTRLAEVPGRLTDAITEYETALRIAPDYFKAHYNLGTLLMDLPGRHAEAVRHLEAAVRLEPDSPEAHLNLGIALADEPGQAGNAIQHLEFAVARRPDFAPAREEIARLRRLSPQKRKGDGSFKPSP